MAESFDNSLHNCFVNPLLCRHLVNAGLTANVPYQWKIRKGVAALCTHKFDLDDYYIAGIKHIDYINPPEYNLPAFNVKDVEQLLPKGYLLVLNDDGLYEVSLSSLYHSPPCSSLRMPDVFAEMLLIVLKLRLVDLNKINLMLAQ